MERRGGTQSHFFGQFFAWNRWNASANCKAIAMAYELKKWNVPWNPFRFPFHPPLKGMDTEQWHDRRNGKALKRVYKHTPQMLYKSHVYTITGKGNRMT